MTGNRKGGLMETKKRKLVQLMVLSLFLILPASEIFADAGELEKEIKMADKVSEQVEKHWDRVTDPVRIARISLILSRLSPFTDRDLPYEARLIDEDRPNAFALPGGRIYLTTGILDFCRSDDELASVIAHELVHTDKKHGMIQSARNQRLSIGALAVIIATGGQGAAPILANLAQVAIMNSYSKDLEKEADTVGLKILLQADYEPAAAVTVMERLQEEEIKRPFVDPGIFAAHPKTRERVQSLIGIIRENGWPLERKKALRLLRTTITGEEGSLYLNLDGRPVWHGPSGESTRRLLEKTAGLLDRHLQMETSPYDVSIMEFQGKQVLRIGLGTVVSQEEILPGMPTLDDLRDKIVAALQWARSAHPVADYHR